MHDDADDDDDDETEYELETFEVGGFSLQLTTVAYLPITSLLRNHSKNVEISGQKLWCGSLGVLQHVLNNCNTQGKIGPRTTVIELGAGTGLLGMVCKLIGASTVILTDHDSVSINHMVLDSQRNGVDVSVRHLNWYDPKLDGLPAISFETNGGDLLVVAGDVLYKQPLVRPFFETVRLLLSSSSLAPLTSSRRMLLCHVPRAGVTHEIVMDSAAAAGLVAVEVLPDEWKRGDCCRYCDADDLLRAKLLEITLS